MARLDKDGNWQTYSKASTNGGLPNDHINALALSVDGAVWVGTPPAGLARLDKDGRWQTYTKADTLVLDDFINALALGAARGLWIGTLNAAAWPGSIRMAVGGFYH